MSEAQPNAYNANKPWHNVKENEFKDSNSLFVPQQADPFSKDSEEESATPTDATQQHDWQKRHSDLKSYHDRKMNEVNQELRDLKAKIEIMAKEKEQPSYQPPKTPEEVEVYRQNNPELLDVMETVTHTKTEALEKELSEIKEREKRLMKKEAQAYLMTAHPDFAEIKDDPMFHEWAENQPSQIKDWIYNNPYDGELAAQAITLYKAAAGVPQSDTQDAALPAIDPDAASLVPTRNAGVETSQQKKIWTRSEIKALTPDQYDRYEDEIDQAIVEGRVLNK